MVRVELPDGAIVEAEETESPLDIAGRLGARLKAAVLAAQIDGTTVDAVRPFGEVVAAGTDRPVKLRLLTDRDTEALGVLRHSAAHVMARAVMRLFPDVQLAFGPTTASGFYYDFDLPRPIREEDFAAIEAEMKRIVDDAEPFERFNLPREEALSFCEGLKQGFKVEHIGGGLKEHPTLGFYRQGEFVDLCRGPHIPDAGRIKAFKVVSVAGAHWKGDQGGRPLQRLYGTAFFSKKDLDAYLEQIEEAKRRDHRVLGKRMGLFHIDPDVGQGLVLWLPKGAMIRGTLEEFLKKELIRRGYEPVYSPHIAKLSLYETSGHFPHYRESQFPPMGDNALEEPVKRHFAYLEVLKNWYSASEDKDGVLASAKNYDEAMQKDIGAFSAEGSKLAEKVSAEPSFEGKLFVLRLWLSEQDKYLLKPMNCPHHAMMYKSRPRSYKQLPLRLAEFGTVYRHEQSGELNGMLRVRGLTQDDAHLFCTPEQVEQEFRDTLELTRFVLESVGLHDYRVQLSVRDPGSDKYVGSEENWATAEAALRKVLTESGLNFVTAEGEAAFYGPKADFMVRDALGREWQLGTVQLDYNLPERFGLEYIGADNTPHRPVMIHRAPFGSMERFVGMLIEHFAGAFPLWLAPEQIRVLPLSEKTNEDADRITAKLRDAGFRAVCDKQDAKLQAKIREAQLDLIPYMFVVGPKEAAAGAVAVRDRIEGDLGAMPLEAAIEKLRAEVDARTVRQVAKPSTVAVASAGEANEY
ncbi:MAG: threonine--tRNA ligase [Planctomycetota bacterium]|nr:threonine--tRNA ligase [Planctomycetaceae bacterium]MDQ3331105.1 threonine--tRNA ligase [Planctomycetota bacterium]